MGQQIMAAPSKIPAKVIDLSPFALLSAPSRRISLLKMGMFRESRKGTCSFLYFDNSGSPV
jgi:hypothetical protein